MGEWDIKAIGNDCYTCGALGHFAKDCPKGKGKGKHGKGLDKGEGKGSGRYQGYGYQGACHYCGKVEHKPAECW